MRLPTISSLMILGFTLMMSLATSTIKAHPGSYGEEDDDDGSPHPPPPPQHDLPILLLPRLWRNAAMPAPAGDGRKPPPIVKPAPKPTEAPKNRKEEVKMKKQRYEHIRIGRNFVNQVLREAGDFLKRPTVSSIVGADGASTSGTKKPGQ